MRIHQPEQATCQWQEVHETHISDVNTHIRHIHKYTYQTHTHISDTFTNKQIRHIHLTIFFQSWYVLYAKGMLTFLVNFHGNLWQVILHVWELVKVVCVDKSRAGQVGAHKTEEMCRWLMILPPAKYPSFVISLPQSSSLSCPRGFFDFSFFFFQFDFFALFGHFFC